MTRRRALRRRAAIGLGVVAALAGGAVAWAGAAQHAAPAARYVYVTYYGWFDNTPPGCATAYSGCAGGTGTYAHPITLASDRAELPVGTRIYYPTVEKYFVMGDDCQECDADWAGHGPDGGPGFPHVDLWLGGKGGSAFAAISCEGALTQSTADGGPLKTPLLVEPPSGLPVSAEPLFAARSGHCYGGARDAVSWGRYRNAASGTCLRDPGEGTTSGRAAGLAACTSAHDEDLAFEGAFLVDRHLCLQTDGSKAGARLVFATCTGAPSQQFELGANGTIAWVQVLLCATDEGGAVRLAACGSAASARWDFQPEQPAA